MLYCAPAPRVRRAHDTRRQTSSARDVHDYGWAGRPWATRLQVVLCARSSRRPRLARSTGSAAPAAIIPTIGSPPARRLAAEEATAAALSWRRPPCLTKKVDQYRVCRACSRCSCPLSLTTHRPVPYSCTRSPPLGSQHVAPRGPNSRGASVHQRVFLAGFFTPAQLAAVICGPSAAKIVLRLRLRPLQHRSCVVRREHFRTAPNTPNSAKTREFISFSFFFEQP